MKIRVENASVSFGKKEILQGISISLPEKELVMVIGPNGCGKTTFLRLLMGFQKPQSGMVFYNDISLQDHTVLEKSRKMAYMPQNPRRQEDDEVFDYVLLGVTPYLNYFSLPGKEEKEQAEQVLAELGLSEFKNRRMGTLSGGEQQMVNFARARMQNTPWLILDEPMASLDYSRQHEFMHRLVEYEKRYGQGILMSVHDPNFALRYADRVIVMGYGKIEGIVSRRENEFENKLTGILNKSYDGHLQLIEKEDYHFITGRRKHMFRAKEFVKAESLKEAYELNQKRSSIVLGGFVWLKMGDRNKQTAIDLSGLGLDTIEENDLEFSIGAMCSLRMLETHEGLKKAFGDIFKECTRHIVGVQFRNCATVGGSIFGRFGFSDILTCMMALDTYVELYKGGIIPLKEFVNLPKDSDILVRVIIKKDGRKAAYMSERQTKTDFPVIACCVAKDNDRWYVAVGARPYRAMQVTLTADETKTLEDLAKEASVRFSYGSNLRGSAEYREHLAKVCIRRCACKITGGEA